MHSDEFQWFLKAVLPDMGYRWRRFDRRNIKRRLRLRMESLRIYELERYAQLATGDPAERVILDSLLRLTITRFFRNGELWTNLEELIDRSAKDPGKGGTLDIWSAGCAGGEEAFSIAMIVDALGREGRLKHPWTIVGSDTDPASIKRTQGASYKWGSVREVPAPFLDRWFREVQGHWTLDQEIRDMVTFHQHDIVKEDPPGLFNIVFMRNSILTYNTEAVQRKALDRIHGCLREPGFLVIGRTERMPEGAGFEEVSQCIFRLT